VRHFAFEVQATAWMKAAVGHEPLRSPKLATLAARSHVQEGTLARSLLSSALDEADPEARRITEILDSIPGAWERTQEGLGHT
jgi:hypothetical protein